MSAVEASLTRLKTDYIDLYQQHDFDPLTPIEETLRALDDLIRQGKVRYIGNSNFPAWRIAEAELTARHINVNPFVSCQDEYSLVVREIEKDLLPMVRPSSSAYCRSFRSRAVYSPVNTSAARRPRTTPGRANACAARPLCHGAQLVHRREAAGVCDARGHTMLELAFCWLVARPPVSSVIAGATKPEQLEQNVKAGGWALTPEDLAEIDRITKG